MKRIISLLIIFAFLLCFTGCERNENEVQIAATTLPVFEFTSRICDGTGITVKQLITENVSCLHDYTLKTSQMRAIENAETIVISGAGLEDFLGDTLTEKTNVINASKNITLICPPEDEKHSEHTSHSHTYDPHIWLSPANGKIMAQNICDELTAIYPEHKEKFSNNLNALFEDFDNLSQYANTQLNNLSEHKIVTFHDGFSYMADAFGLQIVHTIEEESGAEASASELIDIIKIINAHKLSAVFVEENGSTSAAQIIAAETEVEIYQLKTAISSNGYFKAMYHNIDTLKEALE